MKAEDFKPGASFLCEGKSYKIVEDFIVESEGSRFVANYDVNQVFVVFYDYKPFFNTFKSVVASVLLKDLQLIKE